MTAIRRSGGAAAYFWQGRLPDPRGADFGAALARRRFRSIENAASEEVSVGWITAGDPTGDAFAPEDLDAGPAVWLRFRIDKKVLPRKWLMIHRAAAEKSRGRRLSARERRELKDDLTSQLLPRVLPAIHMFDALLYAERKVAILLATSKGARASFGKLFFESFGLPLEAADPLRLGFGAGLDKEQRQALESAEPVRWPKSGGARRRGEPDDARDQVEARP